MALPIALCSTRCGSRRRSGRTGTPPATGPTRRCRRPSPCGSASEHQREPLASSFAKPSSKSIGSLPGAIGPTVRLAPVVAAAPGARADDVVDHRATRRTRTPGRSGSRQHLLGDLDDVVHVLVLDVVGDEVVRRIDDEVGLADQPFAGRATRGAGAPLRRRLRGRRPRPRRARSRSPHRRACARWRTRRGTAAMRATAAWCERRPAWRSTSPRAAVSS